MQTWPDFLPRFSADTYSANVQLPVIRSGLSGHVDQRNMSHRQHITFPATLVLHGAQLPIFEYFIRDLCNDGIDYFNGYYLAENGEQIGVMRIVSGAYKVTTDGLVSTVTCNLELAQ